MRTWKAAAGVATVAVIGVVIFAVVLDARGRSVHWAEGAGAIASLATAASVIGAALWGYFHFVREAPYSTRADTWIAAQLHTFSGVDALQVSVRVRAVGKAALPLCKRPEDRAVVVREFTEEMLRSGGPPDEWPVRKAYPVLKGHVVISSLETMEENHLVPIGERAANVVGYLAEFIVWIYDRQEDGEFAWSATTFVPIDPPTTGTPREG